MTSLFPSLIKVLYSKLHFLILEEHSSPIFPINHISKLWFYTQTHTHTHTHTHIHTLLIGKVEGQGKLFGLERLSSCSSVLLRIKDLSIYQIMSATLSLLNYLSVHDVPAMPIYEKAASSWH